MPFRRFASLILLMLLAACQSESLPPLPTPQLWKVHISPSLSWLAEDLNACTGRIPHTGLLLSEAPAGPDDLAAGELSLRWGAPPAPPAFAVILGWDELAFIVHPDNPLQGLTLDQARAVYAADLRTWAEIDPQLEELGEIQVWTYLESEESRRIFQAAGLDSPVANPFAWIAPSPAEMRAAVTQDPAAIGYLPAGWLDQSVQRIEVESLQPSLLRQPIVALSAGQPAPDQLQWLACIQESLNR